MTSTVSGPRPLHGLRVLVTRRAAQAQLLCQALATRGAEVVAEAAIEVTGPDDPGPLERAARTLAEFDGVAFTSTNAVAALADALERLGLPAESLRGWVASVGPATTAAVRERFEHAALAVQPERSFRAESLVEALTERGVVGERVLLPLSDRARDTLAVGLERAGAVVTRVVAYRTVTPAGLASRVASGQPLDLVVFASPSAVEGYVQAAGEAARNRPCAVIGPVTEAAARAAGLEVAVIAQPSTSEGLVQGIADWWSSRAAPSS